MMGTVMPPTSVSDATAGAKANLATLVRGQHLDGEADDALVDSGASPAPNHDPESEDDTQWLCRRCAGRAKFKFRYARLPWVACNSCGVAQDPGEAAIALRRVELEQQRRDQRDGGGHDGARASGRVLTIPEAARLIRRSVKGLYRLAAAGRLPGAVKIEGKWIVRQAVLLGSAPEGRVPSRRHRR